MPEVALEPLTNYNNEWYPDASCLAMTWWLPQETFVALVQQVHCLKLNTGHSYLYI